MTVYEPQQAAAHSERAAMSLDEQWRMIKENQLMMMAHGVASPRIPEARNLWLISLKLWSCEGEIIDEQNFVVASAIRHLAMLLTDGYSTNFSSWPQKRLPVKA